MCYFMRALVEMLIFILFHNGLSKFFNNHKIGSVGLGETQHYFLGLNDTCSNFAPGLKCPGPLSNRIFLAVHLFVCLWFLPTDIQFRNENPFFWVHGEMNRSVGYTNCVKPRSGYQAICWFCAPVHSPMNPEKRYSVNISIMLPTKTLPKIIQEKL